MTELSRFFQDPLVRAALLERLSDDNLAELARSVVPVDLTPSELERALAKLHRRIEPPQRLRDLVASKGGRLLSSSVEALQSLVVSLSEGRDALLVAFIPRVRRLGTYGDRHEKSGASGLELVPSRKDTPILRGRSCRTALRWEPQGRVAGSIHVPADQLDPRESWRQGWVLVEFGEAPPLLSFYSAQGQDGLDIEFECPAPPRDDKTPMPLPSEELVVTLIPPKT